MCISDSGPAKTVEGTIVFSSVAGTTHFFRSWKDDGWLDRVRGDTMLSWRLAFVTLLHGVASQVGVGVPGTSNSLFGGSRLCNGSFADANLVRDLFITPPPQSDRCADRLVDWDSLVQSQHRSRPNR
jgi:hypothetical protein